MKHIMNVILVALLGISMLFLGGILIEPVEAGYPTGSPQLLSEMPAVDQDLVVKDKDDEDEEEEEEEEED